MRNIVNAALIGFGLAGRDFHAPVMSFIPGFRLKKILTKQECNRKVIEERYPHTEVVEDASSIFSDSSIELVVIATPNTSHFSLAKEALNHGKHVVIDKPFTITVHEADELISLAKEQDRLLSVFQNRRWDSDFLTVRKVVESSILGNIAECEIHFDRFRNTIRENAWREAAAPGSGVMYDLGPHLIDQAICLFGLPNSVTADIRTQRQGAATDDNFELIMHYDNVKVTLKAGMLVRGDLPRYILLGDKGSFIKYGMDVQGKDISMGLTPFTKLDWGVEPVENHGEIITTVNGLDIKGKVASEKGDYREYYNNIYNAIELKEGLAVTPEQARNVIRVIELAFESSSCKKTVDFRI